jgi:hypothetical protein
LFVYRKAIDIIDERFVSYAVGKQDFLGDEDKQKKVMGFVTDENILVHIKSIFPHSSYWVKCPCTYKENFCVSHLVRIIGSFYI